MSSERVLQEALICGSNLRRKSEMRKKWLTVAPNDLPEISAEKMFLLRVNCLLGSVSIIVSLDSWGTFLKMAATMMRVYLNSHRLCYIGDASQ
jgi:hypothetical protein